MMSSSILKQDNISENGLTEIVFHYKSDLIQKNSTFLGMP